MPPILALLVLGVILIILASTLLKAPNQAQPWLMAAGCICLGVALTILAYNLIVTGKFAALTTSILT